MPCGLFLFEALVGWRTVQRVFVPRSAYVSAEVGLRIGETLVTQGLLSPERLADALTEQQQLRQRPVGSLLVLEQVITPEQLHAAIEQQARMPMVRIGQALTALGYITEAQLQEALLQQQADRDQPLGELLVSKGWVSRHQLQTALARKMGFPLVDVSSFPVESEALARLPHLVAARLPALPLMMRNGRLVVALEDPINRRLLEELEAASSCKLLPVLAAYGMLSSAVERVYRQGAATASGPSAPAQPPDRPAGAAPGQPPEPGDPQWMQQVQALIEAAAAQGACAIHIECTAGLEPVQVRFRKDGQLLLFQTLPHSHGGAMLARLKTMFDLDTGQCHQPQEGKARVGSFVPGTSLDLRLQTLPTHSGCEDAVLRLLPPRQALPAEQLNLSPRNLERLKGAARRRSGLLLCVGPADSGKTTALHSLLGLVNTPERKVWTAEDPVEITQPGLRQVQVNTQLGGTFAKALRSILQADPDVILVGEIRERDVARLAVEAALTGKLVLASLPAGSATEATTRLLELGIPASHLADALLGVLGQRLVRRLCTRCRASAQASAEEEADLLHDHLQALDGVDGAPAAADLQAEWRTRFGHPADAEDLARHLPRYQPTGCGHCGGSGFRGRLGLHELMIVSPPLRHLVRAGARALDLQSLALAEGMRSLRQDGIEKVLAGLTTIEEVRASS